MSYGKNGGDCGLTGGLNIPRGYARATNPGVPKHPVIRRGEKIKKRQKQKQKTIIWNSWRFSGKMKPYLDSQVGKGRVGSEL